PHAARPPPGPSPRSWRTTSGGHGSTPAPPAAATSRPSTSANRAASPSSRWSTTSPPSLSASGPSSAASPEPRARWPASDRLIAEGKYREAAMQVPYFIEDLNPLPSARPEKISYPLLGPDQSRFRDRVQSDNRSGCQICHDAVRIDNWFKNTAQGRLWDMLQRQSSNG